MKTHTIIGLVMAALLTSCASQKTGDPNAGGLLGWDRGMADQRLEDKRSALSLLQNANSSQENERAGLQEKVDAESASLRTIDRSYR